MSDDKPKMMMVLEPVGTMENAVSDRPMDLKMIAVMNQNAMALIELQKIVIQLLKEREEM